MSMCSPIKVHTSSSVYTLCTGTGKSKLALHSVWVYPKGGSKWTAAILVHKYLDNRCVYMCMFLFNEWMFCVPFFGCLPRAGGSKWNAAKAASAAGECAVIFTKCSTKRPVVYNISNVSSRSTGTTATFVYTQWHYFFLYISDWDVLFSNKCTKYTYKFQPSTSSPWTRKKSFQRDCCCNFEGCGPGGGGASIAAQHDTHLDRLENPLPVLVGDHVVVQPLPRLHPPGLVERLLHPRATNKIKKIKSRSK